MKRESGKTFIIYIKFAIPGLDNFWDFVAFDLFVFLQYSLMRYGLVESALWNDDDNTFKDRIRREELIFLNDIRPQSDKVLWIMFCLNKESALFALLFLMWKSLKFVIVSRWMPYQENPLYIVPYIYLGFLNILGWGRKLPDLGEKFQPSPYSSFIIPAIPVPNPRASNKEI